MEPKKNLLGDEIFQRIKELGRKRFENALDVTQRLSNPESVTDGELLDALFTYTSHLDVFNPLLPVTGEIFKRYMDKIGMDKTPMGIEREWCEPDALVAEPTSEERG